MQFITTFGYFLKPQTTLLSWYPKVTNSIKRQAITTKKAHNNHCALLFKCL